MAGAVLVALRPLNFLSDDALFYLVIAEHIAQGQGSTFNGLFATNGYHPLWQVVAAMLAHTTQSRSTLLALGVLVQCAFNVFAFIILQRSLPANFTSGARQVFAAVVLCLFVPFGNLYWTEAPLNLFFVACTFTLLRRDGPTSYVTLGMVLGCAFLARLDNVFFVASVFVTLVPERSRHSRCTGDGDLWRRSNDLSGIQSHLLRSSDSDQWGNQERIP